MADQTNWRPLEWEQPTTVVIPSPIQPQPQAPVLKVEVPATPAVSVDVPSLLPDQKPAWYTALLGYRTLISMIFSVGLKILATRGLLGLGAADHTDDVVNLFFLMASFVADASAAWFKLRSPGPGALADPKLVAQTLAAKTQDDAAQLAAAVIKASEVLNKAQALKVQNAANKVINVVKG